MCSVYFWCSALLCKSARYRLFCAEHIAGYNVHIVKCSAHIVKCSVHIFRASASRARLRIFIAGQRVSRLRISSIPSIPSILTWELLFNKQASGSHSIQSRRVSKRSRRNCPTHIGRQKDIPITQRPQSQWQSPLLNPRSTKSKNDTCARSVFWQHGKCREMRLPAMKFATLANNNQLKKSKCFLCCTCRYGLGVAAILARHILRAL